MRKFLCALGAILGILAVPTWAADKPTLTVYTYNSFTADWGPGPAVKKAFEATCGCQLDYVAVEDGAALLTRLQLEGKSTKADIVLGLDTNLTSEATKTGLFAPHGMDLSGLKLPIAWNDPVFVPFDYGYFAIVYDKTKLPKPPASLAELVDGDPSQKILLEDPRTSTPGLGFMLWIKQVYGDKSDDAWAKLKPRILTVSKSWDEAYALFTKGEAPMVLSYTTSPAYHIMEENTDKYVAARFAEGQYMQVEVAGRTANSAHADLAAKFLAFMVTAGFQDPIPTTNWMYPVIAPAGGLPPAYGTLVQPAKALLFAPDDVAAHRKAWIDEWLQAMSR
ncbi:MAG TPA: thiamine ABC transporter substrate binding subunit [Methylomirabilota bacterium]|nr:thiamine ABC transporter substrate binding subunit [Methylomirabilota bacterium]